MAKQKLEIDAFARQALTLGLVTRAQVAQAATARRQVAETGLKPPPFAEVFVQQGVLSAEQRARVQDELDAERNLPRLPGYEILKPLGAGGMGRVYLAVQQSLGRTVALKVLLPELTADPEYRGRFLREARAGARLDHENVTAVYDAGTHQGTMYLAMEFVPGETLYEQLKKGAVYGEREALDLARQLACALEAAHAAGLVHRDVKPDNVMITKGEGGRTLVKLCDLGLAKVSGGAQDLTRTGVTSGSPYYMAPEQARGLKHVDHRADLYGVGAVLYRVLALRPPFTGDGAAEVLLHVVSDEPEPLAPAAQGRCSPGLAQIVRDLMAKDPARRYQSAATLIRDLDQAAAGEMPSHRLLEGKTGSRKAARYPTPPRSAAAADAPGAPAPATGPDARPERRGRRAAALAGALLAGLGLGFAAYPLLVEPPPAPVAKTPGPATAPAVERLPEPAPPVIEQPVTDPFAAASARAAFEPWPELDAALAELLAAEEAAARTMSAEAARVRTRGDLDQALRAQWEALSEALEQAEREAEAALGLAPPDYARAWAAFDRVPESTPDSRWALRVRGARGRLQEQAEQAFAPERARLEALVADGRDEEARALLAQLAARFAPPLAAEVAALGALVQGDQTRRQDQVQLRAARREAYEALRAVESPLAAGDFHAAAATCRARQTGDAAAGNPHAQEFLAALAQGFDALHQRVLMGFVGYLEAQRTSDDDPNRILGLPVKGEPISVYIREVHPEQFRFVVERADMWATGQSAATVRWGCNVKDVPIEHMLLRLGLAADEYLAAVRALAAGQYEQALLRFAALGEAGDERAAPYRAFLGEVVVRQREDDAAHGWAELVAREQALVAAGAGTGAPERRAEPWLALRQDLKEYLRRSRDTAFVQAPDQKAQIRDAHLRVRRRLLEIVRVRTAQSRRYVDLDAATGALTFRGDGYEFRDPTALGDFTEAPSPGSADAAPREFAHESGFMVLSGAQTAWWTLEGLVEGIRGGTWVLRVGVVLARDGGADPSASLRAGWGTLISFGDDGKGTGTALQLGPGGAVRLAALEGGRVAVRPVPGAEPGAGETEPVVLAAAPGAARLPLDRLVVFEIDGAGPRLRVIAYVDDQRLPLVQYAPDAAEVETRTAGQIGLWCPPGLRAYYRSFSLSRARVR